MKHQSSRINLISMVRADFRSFLIISLFVCGSLLIGCAKMMPAEDGEIDSSSQIEQKPPPNMDDICYELRRHDLEEEGELSLEYTKRYSKTYAGWENWGKMVELVEKNRDRLRSICLSWYYDSYAPAVTDIVKGTQTFEWTEACEIAAGTLNKKLEKPELSSDNGDCWTKDEDSEFEDDSEYCQYKRHLRTALDVEEPSDEQDLICYFAVLDRDNDEVPDYMVSDHGRFTQNDIDVDGDGVRNVRDSNPVVADTSEQHACGQGDFPKHLQLASCQKENDAACELQVKLYKEFDVVTVNREFEDDDSRILASLRVIYDVMNLIFKQGMLNLEQAQDDCPGMPTLPSFKTVSFEQCPHDTLRIDDQGNEGQKCLNEARTTGAEAIAQNGTFVVVPVGATYPSLFRLGTYVHELGHLFSFALDYDTHKYEHLVKRNYWESKNLGEVLKPMGWSIRFKNPDTRPDNAYKAKNVLNVQDHVLFDEGSYKWNGFKVAELANMIECGVDKREGCSEEEKKKVPTGYLAYTDELQKHDKALFTWYGAADPWEWYAEAAMAYLYRILSKHIATKPDTVTTENIRVLLRARLVESYPGNDFYFENMSDSLFNEFKKIFPMTESQLDELVCRYIVNSDDVLFGGKWEKTPEWYAKKDTENIGHFKLNVTLEPKEIKSRLVKEWKSTCKSFPNLKQAIVQKK